MSPTQAVATPMAAHTVSSDSAKQLEEGGPSPKKAAVPSGGRSWSEEEEAYLVQTRRQKMPYRHIAAHLKKTELACRLHYHQLLRSTGRRKRTTALSARDKPLEGTACAERPVERDDEPRSCPRRRKEGSSCPHGDGGSSSSSSSSKAESLRLPAILPRPSHGATKDATLLASSRCSTALETGPTSSSPSGPLAWPLTTAHGAAHVDLERLDGIYRAHRSAFWTTLAREYGGQASAAALETAWRTGACCAPPRQSVSRPLTPAASPEVMPRMGGRDRIKISSILATEEEVLGWERRF